ncbi:MAG: hypothetical protein AAFV59_16395 [Pseudomonadota bacterium]
MFQHGYGRPEMAGLSRAFEGLATLGALGGTIIAAPSVWPLVEAAVGQWLYEHYSHEIAFWLSEAAWVVTYPLTFVAIRIGLLAGFTAVALFVVRRLM